MHENPEASTIFETKYDTSRTVKAISHKTVMHLVKDSDLAIVRDKPAEQSRTQIDRER